MRRAYLLSSGGALACSLVALIMQLLAGAPNARGMVLLQSFGPAKLPKHIGDPGVMPWLLAASAVLLVLAAVAIRQALLGRTLGVSVGASRFDVRYSLTLIACVCLLMSFIRHRGAVGTRPIGGANFTGFITSTQPEIVPCLAAAAVLAALGLAAELAGGRSTSARGA